MPTELAQKVGTNMGPTRLAGCIFTFSFLFFFCHTLFLSPLIILRAAPPEFCFCGDGPGERVRSGEFDEASFVGPGDRVRSKKGKEKIRYRFFRLLSFLIELKTSKVESLKKG